jgi:hypothetical protein
MKWTIGILVVFLVCYFGARPIYNAMKKHDYDTLYNGLQNTKRQAGAFAAEKEKPYMTYGEKYARGIR